MKLLSAAVGGLPFKAHLGGWSSKNGGNPYFANPDYKFVTHVRTCTVLFRPHARRRVFLFALVGWWVELVLVSLCLLSWNGGLSWCWYHLLGHSFHCIV